MDINDLIQENADVIVSDEFAEGLAKHFEKAYGDNAYDKIWETIAMFADPTLARRRHRGYEKVYESLWGDTALLREKILALCKNDQNRNAKILEDAVQGLLAFVEEVADEIYYLREVNEERQWKCGELQERIEELESNES